jgi:hypothetical protein
MAKNACVLTNGRYRPFGLRGAVAARTAARAARECAAPSAMPWLAPSAIASGGAGAALRSEPPPSSRPTSGLAKDLRPAHTAEHAASSARNCTAAWRGAGEAA